MANISLCVLFAALVVVTAYLINKNDFGREP
jgi:hypothetical protein